MYQIVKHCHEDAQEMSAFKASSRFLWDDHVSYTRNAIVSILSSLHDIDAISLRLVKNQEDIGAFISPYYTAEQTATFVDLLKKHIVIAVDVINGVDGAEALWRENGDNLVSYMSEMNPMFWPISVTKPIWSDHLDMTIAQVAARKSNAWDEDINMYDKNHQHMSIFADLIATGIIYQNIEDFCLKG